MRDSVEQKGALADFTAHMKARLAKKPSVVDQLMPSFPPVCRRLTPGPGYLEALAASNVDMISSPIREVFEDGIITEDGAKREVDLIACATGFYISFLGRYPIYGVKGITSAEKWKSLPKTYMSLAADGFPNHFSYLGPNSALGTGNLLIVIERLADYFTECEMKTQRDNIAAMSPKAESVADFVNYCDKYFEKTVFTLNCRSWYKGGDERGRVSALWPGSSLHAIEALAHPRWEDFDYTYMNNNSFGWFGNRWTDNEVNKTIDVDYLDDENIDYPNSARKTTDSRKNHNGVEQILNSRLESDLQVNGCDGQEVDSGVVEKADGLEHVSNPEPMTTGKEDVNVHIIQVEHLGQVL